MKKGLFCIIIAGVLWGCCGVFVRLLSPFGLTSLQITALRLCGAFLVLFLYCLATRRYSALRVTLRELLILVPCGLALFATSAFYFAAIQFTSISTAAVLMCLAPLPVLLFSVLHLGERFTLKKLLAVCMMLVGGCLVSGIVGGFNPGLTGILAGLAAALSYAAYNILTKLAVNIGKDPVRTTVYTFLFAALASLAFCRPHEIPAHLAQKPAFTLPLAIALGIVTCVVPYLLYSAALRVLSVGTASALGIVEPLSATLIGFIAFRESMTVLSVCGAVLVVAAVVLLSRDANGDTHVSRVPRAHRVFSHRT